MKDMSWTYEADEFRDAFSTNETKIVVAISIISHYYRMFYKDDDLAAFHGLFIMLPLGYRFIALDCCGTSGVIILLSHVLEGQ